MRNIVLESQNLCQELSLYDAQYILKATGRKYPGLWYLNQCISQCLKLHFKWGTLWSTGNTHTHILSSFLLLLDNLYTKFRHIFKNISLKANLSGKMYHSLTQYLEMKIVVPWRKFIKVREEVTNPKACSCSFGRICWSNPFFCCANAK